MGSDNCSELEVKAAQRVREEFVFGMRNWLAQRVGTSSSEYGKHRMPTWDKDCIANSYWMKIAKRCIAEKMHPRRLASTLFSRWRVSRQPTPNMLMAESVWETAHDDLPDDIAALTQSFRAQMSTWQHAAAAREDTYRMTKQDALVCVLRNPTEQLTPLFRYCAAVKIGNQLVADHYMRDASLQYVLNAVVYDVAWQSVLPEGFSEAAHSLWKLSRGV